MALEGLLVPAVTLFSDAGALDGPRNSKYVRGLLDDGIRHILTLGRPGESTLLTPAERETLVERVVESVTFGSEVWAGIGGGSTEESVAQADSAEAAGAAVLVVRAPAGTPPAGSVLSEHFRTLRAQTKLPLVAYNVPQEVGYPLPPIVVHELGRDGTLQGLLDGGDDARARAAYREGAPEGLALFGDEADLGPGGPSTGLHGVCLESANVLPRLVVKFLELAKKGDAKGAEALLSLHRGVVEALRAGPYPATLKFLAAYLRDTEQGYRAPNLPLSAEQRAAVQARVDPQKAQLQEYA